MIHVERKIAGRGDQLPGEPHTLYELAERTAQACSLGAQFQHEVPDEAGSHDAARSARRLPYRGVDPEAA
jgi:hypothetical protein